MSKRQKKANYEIGVKNGVYRIRAKVGDLFLPSWQNIVYESVDVDTFQLAPGEMKWTPEKVIKVKDGKLTIRIFIDVMENKTAGLSEIVFQQAY